MVWLVLVLLGTVKRNSSTSLKILLDSSEQRIGSSDGPRKSGSLPPGFGPPAGWLKCLWMRFTDMNTRTVAAVLLSWFTFVFEREVGKLSGTSVSLTGP